MNAKKSAFLTIFGFSFGLITAGFGTYLFIRQRMLQQNRQQNQPIDLLKQQDRRNGTHKSRPTGQIRRLA